MKKYVIINSSEVSEIDFSKVQETSASTLRYSLDNSEAIVKYEGNQPSFLSGKTEYTWSEIMEVLNTSEWLAPEVNP